ncbi:MAG: IPT/TIG domain-containing protein [Bacteroidales bacterium]|jgi:hypothetical protein|nr:IPT/TIG domain-containing protein [Bacteroidales bacterium]
MKIFDHYLIRQVNNTFCRCLAVTGLAVFFLASCNPHQDEKTAYDPNQPIELTSFHPDSGRIREMILLDGKNFGSDPSIIKVFFNEREAKVIGSTGTRILVAVPRMPGDTCTVTVEIGEQRKNYFNRFRYQVAASVTTVAGNGTGSPKIFDQGLDKTQLIPVYIGADKEFNIFVTDNGDNLLRINEEENLIQLIANAAQGFNHRCQISVNPRTNVIQMGAENAGNRDRFAFFDPKKSWAMTYKYIKEWDLNGYQLPAGAAPITPVPANHFETHHHCLFCEADEMYYTRYQSGALVRIDPDTWNAKIIGMTPVGIAYGLAFHPFNKNELWIAYDGVAEANTGAYAHSICRVNVLDETKGDNGILASLERLSGPSTAPDHRDGPLELAQFNVPRAISFDADGNLFIGDCNNHCVRMINTMSNPMTVETTIGIPGIAGMVNGNKEEARFNGLHGIATDAEGSVFVSDYRNNRVRKVAIE